MQRSGSVYVWGQCQQEGGVIWHETNQGQAHEGTRRSRHHVISERLNVKYRLHNSANTRTQPMGS